MKNWLKTIIIVLAMGGMALPAAGQIVDVTMPEDRWTADSIRHELDKDTYFVGGTVLGGKPTQYNSDVKFQISFQQRLTKSVLPFHTYLYLFYT